MTKVVLSAVEVNVAEREVPVSFVPYSKGGYEALRASNDLYFVGEGRQLLVVPFSDERADLPTPRMMPIGPWLPAVADILEMRLRVLAEVNADNDLALASIDLTRAAHERADIRRADLLSTIQRPAKVHLGVRCIQREPRRETVVLTMDVGTSVTCDGTLAHLLAGEPWDVAGIGIAELPYGADGPRFVGVARELTDGMLVVNTKNGIVKLDPSRCGLFPSLATLQTLRERIYAPNILERLIVAEREIEDELLSDGQLSLLRDVARGLQKRGSVRIARGITITCGDLVMLDALPCTASTYRVGGERESGEPRIAALAEHGPFHANVARRPRIVVVAPRSIEPALTGVCDRLLHGADASSSPIVRRGVVGMLRLQDARLDVIPIDVPNQAIGGAYVRAVEEVIAGEKAPDLVLIASDDGFDDADDPYLASAIALLRHEVPSIQLRPSRVIDDVGHAREEVLLTMCGALGVQPWVLANPRDRGERVFGIGSAVLGRGAKRRVRAIATAFASDGRFLGARCSSSSKLDAYGAALRAVVHEVVGREPASHYVFHLWPAPGAWNLDDLLRIIRAEIGDRPASFLTVRREHTYTMFDPQGGIPAPGTSMRLVESTSLLAVQGPAPESGPIRKPLLLQRHEAPNAQALDALVRQVFQFTRMHGGKNHQLREPVTLFYVRLLAKLMTRLERQASWSDDLLASSLWSRAWFL